MGFNSGFKGLNRIKIRGTLHEGLRNFMTARLLLLGLTKTYVTVL